jgi:zinc protease
LAFLAQLLSWYASDELAEYADIGPPGGGVANGYTGRDFTVFFANVPPKYLARVIELESIRHMHPTVTSAGLAREKLQALAQRSARVDLKVMEAAMDLTWSVHRYGQPVGGFASDIESITPAMVKEFYKAHYIPSRVLISIAGNFQTESALASIRAAFQSWNPVSPPIAEALVEPKRDEKRRMTMAVDSTEATLMALWAAPPPLQSEEALDVSAEILKRRLGQSLKEAFGGDAESAHVVTCAFWILREAVHPYIVISVRSGTSLQRVETALDRTLAMSFDMPVSVDELEVARNVVLDDMAKRHRVQSVADAMRSTHAMANALARDTIFLGAPRSPSQREAEVRSVSTTDVEEILRTHFNRDQRSVIHARSTKGP